MSNITLRGANGTYIFDPENHENHVGEGGMGRVFKGEQTEPKENVRKVAIKVLFKEFTKNQNNIERFKIESTVKIRHKNLIEMIDFVEDEGRFHIISEFLEGEVLCDKIERLNNSGQSFELDEVKKIILAVADGLEELHKNGIVHRDLKPSNIMLLNDGGIKLFDYGVIKKNNEVITKLTRDGSFVGSIQYASPEQIKNIDKAAINESTDVYSLGITLYELITGKVPFDGASEYEIMDKHTKEIIPLHSRINKSYYNLIVNATAKDQKYRYKSITQFKDDLLRLPNGHVSLIRNEWWQTKNFKVAAMIAIVFIIGTVAFYLFHQKQNRENYTANVAKAEIFYSIAKYDSAKVYYEKAIEYIVTDSIKHKDTILNTLIPGMQNFYNAKYKEAYNKLKKAADMGSGDAYYYLAKLAYNGFGTIKDYKKALEYSYKAKDNGFSMGYFRIAMAYEQGKGVEKDKDKADKYYFEVMESAKKMAEVENPEALQVLGWMYLAGSGVVKNEKIGFDYYLRSAKAGHPFAETTLANMYRYGSGADKDIDKAIEWYSKAADKGDPKAQYELAAWYFSGDDGISKNTQKGLEIMRMAAEQNYSESLNYMGALYVKGEVMTQDYSKGSEYYKKAIEFDNDNFIPMENLAGLYSRGLGVDKNYSLAKDYYLRAIKTDTSETQNYIFIAKLYLEGGYGLQQSDAEFISYCELAERAGNLKGREELSSYYGGKAYKAILSEDYVLARRYLNLAFSKGNTKAQNILRLMNERGL